MCTSFFLQYVFAFIIVTIVTAENVPFFENRLIFLECMIYYEQVFVK